MLRNVLLLRRLALVAALAAPAAVLLALPPLAAPQPSLPLEARALGREAEAITVRLEGAISGSGVIVARQGGRYTVLTAWHVLRDNRPGEEIALFTPDGRSHPVAASAIQPFAGIDLARLSFSSDRSYAVARLGRLQDLDLGSPLLVAGFPSLDRAEGRQPLRLKFGRLEARLPSPQAEGYQLLYSNETLPGMSGGPVLNERGELLGIHGRAELHTEASRRLGKPMATSTNMGLTIAPYLALLAGGTEARGSEARGAEPGARSAQPAPAELSASPVASARALQPLEQALSLGQFAEADALTRSLLLAEPGQGEWLSEASVPQLRCGLLLAVDASWRQHSLDRFGFSAQRRLWPGDFAGFAALAGWRRAGFVRYIEADGSVPPRGYYPRRVADGPILQALLARFGRCQTEPSPEPR
ncbi:MAG: hypothetical protein RLZZ624_972 [Cyanobacteriota bacterium]